MAGAEESERYTKGRQEGERKNCKEKKKGGERERERWRDRSEGEGGGEEGREGRGKDTGREVPVLVYFNYCI